MVNKETKQRQIRQGNPFDNPDAITGFGEFTAPIAYKWTCSAGIVHITTKDRYRGVVTIDIPLEAMREIIDKVDHPDPEVYDSIGAKAAAAEAIRLKKQRDKIEKELKAKRREEK